MSKPIHPIRKMRRRIERSGAILPLDILPIENTIARHVKPLLDALELEHDDVEHGPCSAGMCPTCNLLAAWRAKL